MKRFLFIFVIICILIQSEKTQAQVLGGDQVDQIISMEVIPSTPRSNEDVTISIESFSFDLSRAKIDWYLNDSLKGSGVGKTIFNFRTGDVGTRYKIRYQITTNEGVYFEKNVTISPGDISLIWESSSYTPPFYKGKSMFSYEGSARIIAIPNLLNENGAKYKPEDLVYTWKRGMGTDIGASGYGKNIFLWNGGLVSSSNEITVEVSNLNNTTKATASINIEPQKAEILAYENSPSLGILWNNAITNTFKLNSNEVSFIASPYYFNNPNSEGIYSWFVNGNKSPEQSQNITFRNTTNESGESKITFGLDNQKRILQSADGAFDVLIEKEGGNSPTSIFKDFFSF